jgi:hypothetical protein
MTKLSDHTEFKFSETGLMPNLKPSASFDVAHYQTLLDAPDLSAEQKTELLQALWTMITCLVDLGFEVLPTKHKNDKPEGTNK